MRIVATHAAIIATLALVACSSPPPQAASERCDSFARSGGYPILTGGPTYGPNSNIERLPASPPLIFGPFDDDIKRHLDEEDYLRGWCQQNM